MDLEIIEVPNTLDLGQAMNAPASSAARAGGLIFTGGYISFDPDTGKPAKGTIEEETSQTLRNIEKVLIVAGSNKEKIVKVIRMWTHYK